MTHKPGCQANISCLVYHPDGVCDKYRCTCDLLGEKSAERLKPLPEKIEIDWDKHELTGELREKINEILDYLKDQEI